MLTGSDSDAQPLSGTGWPVVQLAACLLRIKARCRANPQRDGNSRHIGEAGRLARAVVSHTCSRVPALSQGTVVPCI